MIYEKSCGAVIFTGDTGNPKFLIEKMRRGHFSLCKGHVENHESEHETADREIFEETGLHVEYVDGFRETIKYSPYTDCVKEVVFFLAKADGTDTVAQESEVSDIFWLSYEDAMRTLTHASDRSVLTKANDFFR